MTSPRQRTGNSEFLIHILDLIEAFSAMLTAKNSRKGGLLFIIFHILVATERKLRHLPLQLISIHFLVILIMMEQAPKNTFLQLLTFE